jgi:cysteine desulfurase
MIYLDHAATTPLAPEVLEAMLPYLRDDYGNPSSMYHLGRLARKAVEDARERVAAWIGARPGEIVFTSGGTESDNYALLGGAQARRERGRHLLTTPTEHHAVLHAAERLAREGYEVGWLPVDAEGRVDPAAVAERLRPDTILVSVLAANNEIGTLQPLAALGAVCAEHGVPFHTDAVQALAFERLDVRAQHLALLAGSAHKLNGPKGVGFAYVRTGTRPAPLLVGGAQERNRRAGTENVAGIVGLGAALALLEATFDAHRAACERLRDRLLAGLLAIPGTHLNGPASDRLANHISVCFEHISAESLLILLDGQEIAASSGSACASGATDPSHVLLAIGRPPELAHGALRLTVGRGNTEAEIDTALAAITAGVARLRELAPA